MNGGYSSKAARVRKKRKKQGGGERTYKAGPLGSFTRKRWLRQQWVTFSGHGEPQHHEAIRRGLHLSGQSAPGHGNPASCPLRALDGSHAVPCYAASTCPKEETPVSTVSPGLEAGPGVGVPRARPPGQAVLGGTVVHRPPIQSHQGPRCRAQRLIHPVRQILALLPILMAYDSEHSSAVNNLLKVTRKVSSSRLKPRAPDADLVLPQPQHSFP